MQTTVICLDDYHCLDRNGRKEKAVTALAPEAQHFDLMYEQASPLQAVASRAAKRPREGWPLLAVHSGTCARVLSLPGACAGCAGDDAGQRPIKGSSAKTAQHQAWQAGTGCRLCQSGPLPRRPGAPGTRR